MSLEECISRIKEIDQTWMAGRLAIDEYQDLLPGALADMPYGGRNAEEMLNAIENRAEMIRFTVTDAQYKSAIHQLNHDVICYLSKWQESGLPPKNIFR